ncbi:preprotein translocase subunit YajC [Enterococcus timonensis]|uniref:preprotein translocase subunit YajC n=1 Tax=Enterococcus timonensis TaxID=1852364 RepID=UPI0008DAD251|nr:preprotein translocase subunit YajC [Enterococcus timonensis]
MVQLIIPIIFLGGLMWWMNRSQKKQQKSRQDQLDAMKVGDSVVTIGGLHGVLFEINKEKGTVTLDCEGIYLEFDRASVKSSKANVAADKESYVVEGEDALADTTEDVSLEDSSSEDPTSEA